MKKYKKLFTLAVTLTLSLCISTFATGAPIQAKINVNNDYLDDQTDIEVAVTLTNISEQPVKLLRWNLPEAKLDTNAFSITRDGIEINYQGRLIKHSAPEEKDYLVLDSGESYSSTVELSTAYDISITGTYEIQLRINNLITEPATSQSEEQFVQNSNTVHSNKVSLWLEGNEFQAPVTTQPESNILSTKKAGPIFRACSNSQRYQINRASNFAGNMSRNAYYYLANGSTGSRYTTWFGRYNSSRYNRARNNFSAISNAISSKPVTYDCSCRLSYYAYVYPGQPYTIYLCNAFWGAPTTGTNSKAGTIIHELSHFYVVASTNDHAYGHSASKSLARNSPYQAVRNADNHEYFAENTPYLP